MKKPFRARVLTPTGYRDAFTTMDAGAAVRFAEEPSRRGDAFDADGQHLGWCEACREAGRFGVVGVLRTPGPNAGRVLCDSHADGVNPPSADPTDEG